MFASETNVMQCINDLGSSIDGESFETLSTSHRHDIWDTSRLKLRIAVSYCGDYFTDSLNLVRSATYRGGSCLKRTAAAVVCCLPARCGWQSEQLTLPAPRTRPTAGLPKAARVAADIFLRFIGRFLFVCFQLAAGGISRPAAGGHSIYSPGLCSSSRIGPGLCQLLLLLLICGANSYFIEYVD